MSFVTSQGPTGTFVSFCSHPDFFTVMQIIKGTGLLTSYWSVLRRKISVYIKKPGEFMMTFRSYMSGSQISTAWGKYLVSWITDPCWVWKVKLGVWGHPGRVWWDSPRPHRRTPSDGPTLPVWFPVSVALWYLCSRRVSCLSILWETQACPWSHLTVRGAAWSPAALCLPPYPACTTLLCGHSLILLPLCSPGPCQPSFVTTLCNCLKSTYL